MCVSLDYGKGGMLVRCIKCKQIHEDVFIYPTGLCVYCTPKEKNEVKQDVSTTVAE